MQISVCVVRVVSSRISRLRFPYVHMSSFDIAASVSNVSISVVCLLHQNYCIFFVCVCVPLCAFVYSPGQ